MPSSRTYLKIVEKPVARLHRPPIHPGEVLRDDVLPFGLPRARQGDVTIFHFALPSAMSRSVAISLGVSWTRVTPSASFAAAAGAR